MNSTVLCIFSQINYIFFIGKNVDFRNDGAKALYERLGFKVFNKKRVKIGGFERGMYNMELIQQLRFLQ